MRELDKNFRMKKTESKTKSRCGGKDDRRYGKWIQS